jgi:hypothetical protein
MARRAPGTGDPIGFRGSHRAKVAAAFQKAAGVTVFIIRRMAQSLLVLFVTSIIVFAGIYAVGDPMEI